MATGGGFRLVLSTATWEGRRCPVSIEESLRQVVEETVRAVIDRELRERLSADGLTLLAPPDDRPLGAKELQERGYTEQEAYGLLRNHGLRMPGGRRIRIARSVLERIERGEIPA